MYKRILLTSFFSAMLLSSAGFAHPVVTVSLGSDRANVYSTKTIMMVPPFSNTYLGRNNYDTQEVAGIFLGTEAKFLPSWTIQLGLSVYQNSAFTERGDVQQFSDPNFTNLNYQYHIQSRRVLFETKVSPVLRHIWQPYLAAGVGEAFNYAYGYSETPRETDAVPMPQPFTHHSTKSFTYSVGLGFDVNINKHLRVGCGYRYLNLGNASLGASPLQSGTNTISNSHLRTNEFLAQFSYIG